MKKLTAIPSLILIILSMSLSNLYGQTRAEGEGQVLSQYYSFQANLFAKNLADITDLEAEKRIHNTNSLQWIVGHTLDIQYNLALILGVTDDNPYAEQFAYGTPFDEDEVYPALSKMRDDWNKMQAKIAEAFKQLTKERLSGDAPFPIPYPEQSFRGLVIFQMHHLGYELGQLGIYRKFLEKDSFSY